MPDALAAVQALNAAGKDTEALSEAINSASFLDAIPGEDRQKLRAARSKLTKLEKEAEEKKIAAALKSAADRSPFVKESYDVAEFPALVEKYDKLAWRILSKPGGATMKPDEFYTLYGFHMEAVNGSNTAERPMWAEKGGLDFEGRAKWDAWTAVKGMRPDKAKLEFVKMYYEFSPQTMYQDHRGGFPPSANGSAN